ncbi:hypothetical protein GCM10027569_73490 [Flindersiella endophytica]
MSASACGYVRLGAGSGGGCAEYVEDAQSQIDRATQHLRAVQNAASEMDARQEASDGMAAFRTGLMIMRDRGDCFPEDDRAWAVQSLEIWQDDKAFTNVMGCYYVKVRGETVPNFCNFEE